MKKNKTSGNPAASRAVTFLYAVACGGFGILVIVFLVRIARAGSLSLATLLGGSAIQLALLTAAFVPLSRIAARDTTDDGASLRALHRQAESVLRVFFKYFDESFLLVHTFLTQGTGGKPGTGYLPLKSLLEEINLGNAEAPQTASKPRPFADSLDSFHSYSESLLRMVKNTESRLRQDTEALLDSFAKRREFSALLNRLFIEYEFYSVLIREIFTSVISRLAGVSQPLSEEILAIKENLTAFVAGMKTWEDDLDDAASQNNFSRVIEYHNLQNEGFSRLFADISKNYDDLQKGLSTTLERVQAIAKHSNDIQEIAEQIDVLSINAGIAAARAGVHGRSFQVIAEEVKKLAGRTGYIIKDVLSSVAELKEVIGATISNFDAENRGVTESINTQKNDFGRFYDILVGYDRKFRTIFASISGFAEEVNSHMTKFNPIFQLQAITIQEMERLDSVIAAFLDGQKEKVHSATEMMDQSEREAVLNEMVDRFAENAASDYELEAVDKVAAKYGLQRKPHARGEAANIDMF